MPICGPLWKRKYQSIKSSTMIHVDEDDPVGELEPAFQHRDVTIKRGVDAKEYYDLLTEIGRGKFGTVYHCREKATGLELAAKFVGVTRREDRRNAEREVDIMRQLRHPRLIQLYDAFDTGKLMCVVLELITGGELFERVIDDDFVLTEKACTVFMRQICEGIEFVHQQNILHLDMKPENILCLTKTGNRIKIIDFGLARKFDPSKKLQILFGTPEFVAPEVVNFDQIGYGTDMWSIGVICYVLLSGLSPFMGETDVETMANVTIAKYDFDDEAFNEISEDAKDFIKKLLVKDKQGRLTAQQCTAHKWLQRRPPPVPEKKKDLQTPVIVKPKHQPDELDVTKDNLRMFVERWSEHPNSPYLFDVATHEITPCVSLNSCNGLERSSSQHSLGGCSPSPCGSINSSPDSVIETDDVLYRNDHTLHVENRRPSHSSLYGLERRASDSSCFVHKKADITLRVNLAEEIKKLSDRLYMLSNMNTDLGNSSENKNSEVTHEVNNVTEKLANGYSLTSSIKSGSTANGGLEKTDSSSIIKTSLSKTKDCAQSSTSYKSESRTVKQSPENGFARQSSSSTSSSTKTNTSALNGNNEQSMKLNGQIHSISKSSSSSFFNKTHNEENDNGTFSNIPWSRRKFKLTNSSRDVPLSPTEKKSMFGMEFDKRRERIDNFVNSNGESSTSGKSKHFYKKTEENGDVKNKANNTKDLLLHLLDQWDENQSATNNNYHSGRHKSVSMEWSEAEKVASKSMNTINTFFRKQSSISSSVKKKQEALASNGYK